MIRINAIQVTICFNAARICFRTGITAFPNTIAVFQFTGISLSEVEHVIIRVHSQQVGYIHRTAKEFDGIIRALKNVDILNLGTVSNTVQCQSVVLDIGSRAGTGIADFHISQ